MKKRITLSMRAITFLVMIGLLLGAAFAGVMVFNGSVFAQTTGGKAAENDDDEDDDDEDDEGPDTPITGDELELASAAALEYIGEGRVTDTEVGDEEGYYEIEITRGNGSQVDVHLDQKFNVLGHEDD